MVVANDTLKSSYYLPPTKSKRISFSHYYVYGAPFLHGNKETFVLLSDDRFKNDRKLTVQYLFLSALSFVYVYNPDSKQHYKVTNSELFPLHNHHSVYLNNKQTFDCFFAIAPLLIKKNTTEDYHSRALEVGCHFKTLQRWAAIFRKTHDIFQINRHKETRVNLKQSRVIDSTLEDLITEAIGDFYNHSEYFPLLECYRNILSVCKSKGIVPPSKATVFRRVQDLVNVRLFRERHKNERYRLSQPDRVNEIDCDYSKAQKCLEFIPAARWSGLLFKFAIGLAKNNKYLASDLVHSTILHAHECGETEYEPLRQYLYTNFRAEVNRTFKLVNIDDIFWY